MWSLSPWTRAPAFRRTESCAPRCTDRGAFDLLLHLQLSIRASAVAALTPAPCKLGFDKARARELQWLFTNARIAARSREHVLDSFLGFADALGMKDRDLRWDIPLPADAVAYARAADSRFTTDARDQRLLESSRPQLVCRTLCRRRGTCGCEARHARNPVRRSKRARARDGAGDRPARARRGHRPGGSRYAAAAARAARARDGIA